MLPLPALLLLSLLQAPDPSTLVAAVVSVDTEAHEIVIELPAIDLAAHSGHHGEAGYPPVVRATLPVEGSLYGFRVELRDTADRPVPDQLLHHFNLIDPNRRELFLPISRRVMAAGQETGEQKLPWFFFGFPIHEGDVLVANAMLHNPTGTEYKGVRTRLVLRYVPAGRPWPLFDGHPFQLDVGFPVGDKSFPLPPGESTRSYEARPLIPGKIVAIGGHIHEMGTRIELTEVESGRLIWSAAPSVGPDGEVESVPIGKLWGLFKVGAPVRPDRTYRVTVHYDNTTGATIEEGGMGVVGGLFVPARGFEWPLADKTDTLYIQDALHYMRVKQEAPAHIHPIP